MRVRFAPSPTGQLHVGNARTALFNWLLARHCGGTFVLRIEDTDLERSTREWEQAIIDDLRWLGLTWDEGPDVGGDAGPYRQSERLALYARYASELIASGAAYYCFCSPEQLERAREEMVRRGEAPRYPGTCRGITRDEAAARLGAGERAVVRLRVPSGREVAFDDLLRGRIAVQTDLIGDPVLLRSDGTPAYNYAVVIDDALMRITHVIRGEDHVSNTPRQLLLYEALGWTPPAFAHLPLVLGPDHAPLSKRHGATSVAEFRRKGYLPEALVNYLALIGWSPGENREIAPLEDLVARFELTKVSHSAGVFDEDKLAWINRHYLRQCDARRLAELAVPYLRECAAIVGTLSERAFEWLVATVPPLAASVDRLEQIPERLQPVFSYDAEAALADETIRAEFASPQARGVVEALASDLAAAPRLTDATVFRAAVGRVRERTGQKGRALLHPIRVALTAAREGAELDLIVPAIDRAAELFPASGLQSVMGCRERAAIFNRHLARLFS
jgi:glutamyl-tRNA synthetase/nondiscriminating glutamyl-tRNA synthetase